MSRVNVPLLSYYVGGTVTGKYVSKKGFSYGVEWCIIKGPTSFLQVTCRKGISYFYVGLNLLFQVVRKYMYWVSIAFLSKVLLTNSSFLDSK